MREHRKLIWNTGERLTVLDVRVCDAHAIRPIDVPAVRVRRLVLGVGLGLDGDPFIRDILAIVDEIEPEGRIDHTDVLYDHIRGVADGKGDGAFESCAATTSSTSILIDGVLVPPYLAISIDGTTAV